MDINRIIVKSGDRILLPNAQRYFYDLISHRSYNFQTASDWWVTMKNGVIYPLDHSGKEIPEGGRMVEDVEFLADEMIRIAREQCDWNWYRIAHIAECNLKDMKTKKAIKDRNALFYEREIPKTYTLQEIGWARNGSRLIKDNELVVAARPLYGDTWQEGEMICLFGASGVGKSILAVQIADEIARTRRVLYSDLELPDVQFMRRYSDKNGHLYHFSDNFFRSHPEPEVFLSKNPEMAILNHIEEIIAKEKIKVLIIDNISTLCKDSARSDKMMAIIYHLKMLRKRYGLSILLVANGESRNDGRPVSRSELAAPQILFSMVDGCFALVKAHARRDGFYFKALKCRFRQNRLGEERVMVFERQVEPVNGMLHFHTLGYEPEINLVNIPKKMKIEWQALRVAELSAEGLSQREIAVRLKISVGKVNALLNGNTQKNERS